METADLETLPKVYKSIFETTRRGGSLGIHENKSLGAIRRVSISLLGLSTQRVVKRKALFLLNFSKIEVHAIDELNSQVRLTL